MVCIAEIKAFTTLMLLTAQLVSVVMLEKNNNHFSLHCPLYVNERTEMLAKLELLAFQPILKNIRFGNETYEEAINIMVFNVVQEFKFWAISIDK